MNIAELTSASQVAQTDQTQPADRTSELDADDFLQLLVTQLTNQDPLEPTSNEELLQQLSAIRDIQLSTTLADSLKTLTGNQRYGSAAALIGKHVTGRIGEAESDAPLLEGVVTGIRFDRTGAVLLELSGGESLPLEGLVSVRETDSAGSSFMGQLVRGVDRTGIEPEVIEGVVTQVRNDDEEGLVLELDSGRRLRIGDLLPAV